MPSEDINEYERTIERLTILFSKGEISEESYKKAIKTIEEKLNKLPRKCPECGKGIPKVWNVCPNCGYDWKPKPTPRQYHNPSNWWYLVPLIFGLLGGVLAYIAVKDEDREMAKSLLGFGIIMFVIDMLLIWAIYSYYISLLSRL